MSSPVMMYGIDFPEDERRDIKIEPITIVHNKNNQEEITKLKIKMLATKLLTIVAQELIHTSYRSNMRKEMDIYKNIEDKVNKEVENVLQKKNK